jgi:hypothetical protein
MIPAAELELFVLPDDGPTVSGGLFTVVDIELP